MKTEFVSIAAHQLRTPISAIKWTLRMILDGDLGPINDEQREFLDKTYKSNERMINLINDLLNVTRIEEGRQVYNPVVADIEEVIRGLIANYEDMARQKNLNLSFEKIAPVVPTVKIDLEKIKLVASNLIENSLKYTPAGGKISVTLGEEDGNARAGFLELGGGDARFVQEIGPREAWQGHQDDAPLLDEHLKPFAPAAGMCQVAILAHARDTRLDQRVQRVFQGGEEAGAELFQGVIECGAGLIPLAHERIQRGDSFVMVTGIHNLSPPQGLERALRFECAAKRRIGQLARQPCRCMKRRVRSNASSIFS